MFIEESKDYLEELSREERTQHLDLSSPCLERGGISTNHRGVLAQFLNTPIYGQPADLCHACHNAKCSNPEHLYWGTRSENVQDAKDNGTFKTVWERMIEKYGYEKACRMNSRGKKYEVGKSNKGILKTEEHKRKISESLKRVKVK